MSDTIDYHTVNAFECDILYISIYIYIYICVVMYMYLNMYINCIFACIPLFHQMVAYDMF